MTINLFSTLFRRLTIRCTKYSALKQITNYNNIYYKVDITHLQTSVYGLGSHLIGFSCSGDAFVNLTFNGEIIDVIHLIDNIFIYPMSLIIGDNDITVSITKENDDTFVSMILSNNNTHYCDHFITSTSQVFLYP